MNTITFGEAISALQNAGISTTAIFTKWGSLSNYMAKLGYVGVVDNTGNFIGYAQILKNASNGSIASATQIMSTTVTDVTASAGTEVITETGIEVLAADTVCTEVAATTTSTGVGSVAATLAGPTIAVGLGIAAGVALYEIAPEFWTNLSNSITTKFNDGWVAFYNKNGKTYYTQEEVDTVLQALIDGGYFSEDGCDISTNVDIRKYKYVSTDSVTSLSSTYSSTKAKGSLYTLPNPVPFEYGSTSSQLTRNPDLNAFGVAARDGNNFWFYYLTYDSPSTMKVNGYSTRYLTIPASTTLYLYDSLYSAPVTSITITFNNLRKIARYAVYNSNYNIKAINAPIAIWEDSDGYYGWAGLRNIIVPLADQFWVEGNKPNEKPEPEIFPTSTEDGESATTVETYPYPAPTEITEPNKGTNPLPTEEKSDDPDIDPDPQPDPSKNPDPNPGDESSKDDPEYPNGDFDDGDSPYIPAVPILSATAIARVYNPTQEEADALGSYMWSTTHIEDLLKIFQNPIDGIISFQKIFATPIVDGRKEITLGYLPTGVESDVVVRRIVSVDCGSISIPFAALNATDFPPYTDIQIYLPFVGIIPLNAYDLVDSQLTVIYRVDVYTGSCIAQLKVKRDNLNAIIYEFPGNCGIQIPLTSGNFIQAVSSTVLSLAAASQLPGMLGDMMSAKSIIHSNLQISRSGSFSANAGMLGTRIPYVIITRSLTADAVDYKYFYGYPANKTVYLKNCSGYTRVKDIILHTSANAAEREEILDLLHSGVYI